MLHTIRCTRFTADIFTFSGGAVSRISIFEIDIILLNFVSYICQKNNMRKLTKTGHYDSHRSFENVGRSTILDLPPSFPGYFLPQKLNQNCVRLSGSTNPITFGLILAIGITLTSSLFCFLVRLTLFAARVDS